MNQKSEDIYLDRKQNTHLKNLYFSESLDSTTHEKATKERIKAKRYRSYDLIFAEKYGLEEAIILDDIAYHIKCNQEKDIMWLGTTWMFFDKKSELFKRNFSMIHPKKFRNAINNLVEKSVLMKGEFNYSSADRTLWYTVIDQEIRDVYRLGTIKIVSKDGESRCTQNGYLDVPKMGISMYPICPMIQLSNKLTNEQFESKDSKINLSKDKLIHHLQASDAEEHDSPMAHPASSGQTNPTDTSVQKENTVRSPEELNNKKSELRDSSVRHTNPKFDAAYQVITLWNAHVTDLKKKKKEGSVPIALQEIKLDPANPSKTVKQIAKVINSMLNGTFYSFHNPEFVEVHKGAKELIEGPIPLDVILNTINKYGLCFLPDYGGYDKKSLETSMLGFFKQSWKYYNAKFQNNKSWFWEMLHYEPKLRSRSIEDFRFMLKNNKELAQTLYLLADNVGMDRSQMEAVSLELYELWERIEKKYYMIFYKYKRGITRHFDSFTYFVKNYFAYLAWYKDTHPGTVSSVVIFEKYIDSKVFEPNGFKSHRLTYADLMSTAVDRWIHVKNVAQADGVEIKMAKVDGIEFSYYTEEELAYAQERSMIPWYKLVTPAISKTA